MILVDKSEITISGNAIDIICEFAGMMESVVNSDEQSWQLCGKMLFCEYWDKLKEIAENLKNRMG